MKLLRGKLTYANVVATIALVLAVGGATAFAASKINGANIKAKSIPGGKLKNDTVTGKQVKEASLGQVPSAARADTATTAANADAVGGLNAATLAAPKAYGYFSTSGGIATLDPSKSSSNIISLTRTAAGRYCVNLPFQAKSVSVTVGYLQGGDLIGHGATNEIDPTCELFIGITNPEDAGSGTLTDGNAYFQAW